MYLNLRVIRFSENKENDTQVTKGWGLRRDEQQRLNSQKVKTQLRLKVKSCAEGRPVGRRNRVCLSLSIFLFTSVYVCVVVAKS